MCNNSLMDWQDLKFFLAVAELGTLTAAARKLDVDHATVGRRISRLEKVLGLSLVHRLPRSCPLTEEGEAIAGLAEPAIAATNAIVMRARGASDSVSGVVRISAPPALTSHFLATQMVRLQEEFPDLRLELQPTYSLAALDRGEADIAIRLSRPQNAGAIMRRVGEMRFGLYAHKKILTVPPDQWRFIAFAQELDHVPQQIWLHAIIAGRQIVMRTNDQASQYEAARAGAGAAVLPAFLCADDPDVVMLGTDIAPPVREIWLMTYPDLRRSPKVRATLDFLARIISARFSKHAI